jgi:hypothetical protein
VDESKGYLAAWLTKSDGIRVVGDGAQGRTAAAANQVRGCCESQLLAENTRELLKLAEAAFSSSELDFHKVE